MFNLNLFLEYRKSSERKLTALKIYFVWNSITHFKFRLDVILLNYIRDGKRQSEVLFFRGGETEVKNSWIINSMKHVKLFATRTIAALNLKCADFMCLDAYGDWLLHLYDRTLIFIFHLENLSIYLFLILFILLFYHATFVSPVFTVT